ncbi:TRK1 [Candida theae]|uniref:Potassium transport protein n=1 Tax=Candida theae TaxID=1198502 RepID=A0AAD5FVX2_9ASCO|nr:TRK1 [Candida theae]KAI5948642.1 TRK1 [Candida theae]
MPSVSNLPERYKHARFKHDVGFKIRNFMQRVISAMYPYTKVILPNFRAVHYFYIITFCFLGSILIYPVKTIPYIDALFFASGASTQAGLNTVDVNNVSLYQQIIFYIIPTLTNPIFIHGSLLLVRLYYFERHFDNIKENSKLNFQMRKSATLARMNSAVSGNSTRLNTANNKELGYNQEHNEVDSSQSSPSLQGNDFHRHHQNGGADHTSEPSDDENDLGVNVNENHSNQETINHAIKFGALPHPKRKKSIDPEDMYRSINMLREKQKSKGSEGGGNRGGDHDDASESRPPQSPTIHFADFASPRRNKKAHAYASDSSQHYDDYNDDDNNNDNDNDDDDDVLVIKPPNEVENATSHNAIFTKKKLARPRRSSWIPLSSRKSRGPWRNRLRKTLSNSSRKRRSQASSEAEDEVDDDASIDSEIDESNVSGDDTTRIGSRSGAENSDAIEDDDDDVDYDGEVDDGAFTDGDEQDDGEISPTHSKPPKSRRKSASDLTEEQHPQRAIKFDNVIPNKGGRNRRQGRPRGLRKVKTPALSGLSSSATAANEYNDADDSDESANSFHPGLSRTMSGNYLSFAPTVGRNSTFMKMTAEQKDELGGIEYRAVKLLIKIIVCYYLGFLIVSSFMLLIWVYCMPNYKKMLHDNAINPGWWAFFTAQSSFNDLGFTLTADSMNSFHENAFVQILCGFLIVIGNTGFPVFLRFIIWVMFKTAPELSLYKESLGFLLDHPRRCFTLLFPSLPTWWLLFTLIALNGFDLVVFCILDVNSDMFDGVPKGYRVLNGLFQAFCTRTVGFSIVDLSSLHSATQVSYMLMMYVSVLPIAISVRRTNVYEEQSLGVYTKDEEGDENTPTNFVGAHLRNQLSYDLWYIFLGLFIICIAEGKKLQQMEFRFSEFAILFEIISAYGTVGMSLGYPGVNTSLSGEFNVVSKLVIIAMMIRGRHRGLPYAIDRAILLPNAQMNRHDEVQERHAMNRSYSDERGTALERVATFARGGPIDGGNNIISRVLTNVEHFRTKRRKRRESVNSNVNADADADADTSDVEQSIHSNNPHYLVTTVSHV